MADTDSGGRSYTFTRQGRSPRTLAILIVIYAMLIGAIILIDAAWWLMGALALVTLPALWDLWQDPHAGICLDDDKLNWHTGRHAGTLGLTEINHIRFDTRWDFSVRVTVVLRDKTRVRLPYDTLPPHHAFETALAERGIRVERHHFRVF